MRKLLSMVLCLSMILSIFACVSVSANTETRNFEFVAQGGSVGTGSISGKAGQLYYAKEGTYVYYKFRIPEGAELTSADLTIHIADFKSKTNMNVTPYVVTDNFWQDDSATFTAPDGVPTMTKLSDAIALNLTGDGSIDAITVENNAVLVDAINTLAADDKDYVILAVKGSGDGSNTAKNVYFVNYSNTTWQNYSEEYASLSATGTFGQPVRKNFKFVAQGGNVGTGSISGVAGQLYYATSSMYVYYKFRIPEGAELTSADLTIHIADFKSKTNMNVTPYVVTDNFWQDDSATFTAPDGVPTMTKLSDAIALNLTGDGSIDAITVENNAVLVDAINTLAADDKDYVIVAVKGSGDGSGTAKNVYFVNYSNETWKNSGGGYASLSTTGTFEAVDDFSDAEVTYNNTTGEYSITTTTTTGEAYLIIASFSGATMNDVELVPVNAADAEEGVISGSITLLDEGTIKIFLWDKATLAPATAVQ